jgi:hypothetical protein
LRHKVVSAEALGTGILAGHDPVVFDRLPESLRMLDVGMEVSSVGRLLWTTVRCSGETG